MEGTYTEQILRSRIEDGTPHVGSYYALEVDLVLGHDATIALIIDEMHKLGARIKYPERVVFAADHFSPPAEIERANILRRFIDFAREEGVEDVHVFKGICHQILLEHPSVQPGTVIVGADSHTVTAGSIGCFSTGLGSSDILYALITGRAWLKIPPAIKIEFKGRNPGYIAGKDLILEVLRTLGQDGALYHSLEFFDSTEGRLEMDDRAAICNMTVECGAKNGLFPPDEVTGKYLDQRDGDRRRPEIPALKMPSSACYERSIDIEISALRPLVACPHNPANVVVAQELTKERIDQAFIGSCAGGRLSDIEAEAKILCERKCASHVRLVIIPASVHVLKAAIASGAIETLIKAGATVCNPSCGPCGGIDKGLLAAGERCISTSNRNFRGRMGDERSSIFLASAATVAASAIEGSITDPRRFLG